MEKKSLTRSIQVQLAQATPEDLWKAATAIVDAALNSKLGGDISSFPRDIRDKLIDTVFHDPSYAERLFISSGRTLH